MSLYYHLVLANSFAHVALLLGLSLVLSSAPAGEGFADPGDDSATVFDAVDRYERNGRALVERIESDSAVAELVSGATELTEVAEFVAGEFAVAYPSCGPHLGSTLGVLDKLDTITVEEIERGYHIGEDLPDAPGFCYHTRDLVVHPATVIVLARREGRESRNQMLAEMLEVLAHLEAVRQLFQLAEPRATGPADP